MKYLLWAIGVLVLITGYHYYSSPSVGGVVCSQEAKICPDGSSVGRTGPNCEFAACPTVTSTTPTPPKGGRGAIQGSVALGPTCPVMSNPPRPECADKPYQTALIVTYPGSTKVLYTFSSDLNGKFSTFVPPGTYVVRKAPSTNMLPRCADSKTITVNANSVVTVNISCDTGIR